MRYCFTELAAGLVHLDARWYNPQTTRFIQPDLWNFSSTGLPVEVQNEVMQFAGLSTDQLLRDPAQQLSYGYVASNPYTFNDYTGLISSEYFKLSNIAGFIKDEGANVAIQTGQAIGGAGQVGLGAALCTGSSGVACGAGAALIAKGADNFYSGITGEKSKAQEGLEQLTGNKSVATTVNAAIDLGTSIYGLVKSVPKIAGGFKDFTLFGKDPTAFEPALKQATQVGLGAEIFASSTTLIDTVSKVCKP